MRKIQKKIALVNGALLLFGFIDTFYVYITSSYFAEVMHSDNIGFFYSVVYVVTLGILFFLQPIVKRLGIAETLLFFLVASILLVTLLTVLTPSVGTIFVLLFFIINALIIWALFDVLLEEFSRESETGRIRGLGLTLMNLGVLLAPLASTLVLEEYSFSGVFLLTLVFYCLLFLFCLVAFRDIPKQVLPQVSFWHALSVMRVRPALWHAYILSFALYFFYAVMIIYMPLYLLEQGFTWPEIGTMFTIMLLPFLFVEYPLGYLADKKRNERTVLLLALAISVVTTIGMALLNGSSFLVWARGLKGYLLLPPCTSQRGGCNCAVPHFTATGKYCGNRGGEWASGDVAFFEHFLRNGRGIRSRFCEYLIYP
jgi:MFS family permease